MRIYRATRRRRIVAGSPRRSQRGASGWKEKKKYTSPIETRAREVGAHVRSLARARKGTHHRLPLSLARLLTNLLVALRAPRSHPLLVRASPMDCQPPRQKLRRNTPTHLPPLQSLRGRPRFAAATPTPTDEFSARSTAREGLCLSRLRLNIGHR